MTILLTLLLVITHVGAIYLGAILESNFNIVKSIREKN